MQFPNRKLLALDTIINFIEGGGQLDIDLGDISPDSSKPNENEESSHIKLRELITNIRKDIKLLPSRTESGCKENEDAD